MPVFISSSIWRKISVGEKHENEEVFEHSTALQRAKKNLKKIKEIDEIIVTFTFVGQLLSEHTFNVERGQSRCFLKSSVALLEELCTHFIFLFTWVFCCRSVFVFLHLS